MNLFAQAELLKPPTTGESINSWFLWAMMLCLMLIVSAVLALISYLIRTWMPDILSRLDKKDELHANVMSQVEDRCETRSKHRSELHAKEMADRDKRFLAHLKEERDSRDSLMNLVFNDEDIARVLRRRGRSQNDDGQTETA